MTLNLMGSGFLKIPGPQGTKCSPYDADIYIYIRPILK